MFIEINQDAMSAHIRIMGDKEDWRSEIAFVHKWWDWKRDTGPLFQQDIIEPAKARVFSFSHDGQGPVKSLLLANIYNALAIHLAYQLDQLFKTREDFKRKIKVVESGPVFYVEWVEDEDSDGVDGEPVAEVEYSKEKVDALYEAAYAIADQIAESEAFEGEPDDEGWQEIRLHKDEIEEFISVVYNWNRKAEANEP